MEKKLSTDYTHALNTQKYILQLMYGVKYSSNTRLIDIDI